MARKRGEPWRFLHDVPNAYNPAVRADGSPEVPWGRAWSLARAGDRALVEVEANAASLAAYAAGTLPKTGRLAIQTEGRSAVERYLGERALPRRLLVTAGGIRRRG